MNQTNIDYLFQAITALPDRSPANVASGDGDVLDFGNHLAEASATTFAKLPSSSDYQTAEHHPPSGTVPVDATSYGHEQYGDQNNYASVVEETTDSEVASQSWQAEDAAGSSEQTEVTDIPDDGAAGEPQSSGAEESQESTAQDEDPADNAVEAATVVVAPEQRVCTFVAEMSADIGADSIDVTSPSVNVSGETEVANTPPMDVTAVLPTDDANAAAAIHDSIGVPHDPLIATATANYDDDTQTAGRRRKGKSEDRAVDAVATGSKKSDRSSKRGATPEADSEPAEHTEGSGRTKQFTEAIIASIATTDDKATNEEFGDKNSPSQANAKSDGASSVNRGLTAVANGVATTLPGEHANGDAAKGSSEKVSKPKGLGKYDAVVEAARTARPSAGNRSGAKSTADADEIPRVDPARFVGRVAKAIQTAHERGSSLQLRLSPPELGAVKLALTVKDGVMTASLETETASARRLLLDHLPALRERMAAQNIRIERFDVDVQRDGSEGRPDSPASQQQQQQHSREDSAPRRTTTARQPVVPTLPPVATTSQTIATSSGINVVA